MLKTFLYLKELSSGLKYLGITTKNPFKYKGSGKYWKRHLKHHNISNKDIKTTILLKTEDKEELRQKSLYYSELWDIVNNELFLNLAPESGIGTYGFKFSKDSKDKMNKDKKVLFKGKKNPFYGKKHSKAVLDKIIQSNLGKKIPIEQTLKSIKGRNKPILQYDLDMTFIREWESSKQIEKELGFSSSCITGCCKGRYKKSKGFKWRYKYENNKTNNQYNIWKEENNQ
jgi:hypothetical protein